MTVAVFYDVGDKVRVVAVDNHNRHFVKVGTVGVVVNVYETGVIRVVFEHGGYHGLRFRADELERA